MAISCIIRSAMLVFTIVFFSHSLLAQISDSLNTTPEPRGGITKMAVEFFKINFTPSQRIILDQVQMELIFTIDSTGKAFLEDVNGITDQSLVDSLRRKASQLPLFKPAMVGGHASDGLYSMLLQYPTYKKSQVAPQHIPTKYRSRLTRDDFVDYELGGRMDVMIGGSINSFTGTAHDYLQTGGGFKVDLSFAGKHGYGGGFMMSFYGNERKKDYPIDPSRTQDKESLTLMIGPIINKTIKRTERTSWLAQFEPAYTLQNISNKINNQDKDNVQFKGFSPGITLHYMIRIGREHFSTSYDPALFGHYVNLHAGIRPLFYNSSAGSGVMVEFGISYRMQYHFFESYTLKE